jgi:hypothetical protein
VVDAYRNLQRPTQGARLSPMKIPSRATSRFLAAFLRLRLLPLWG